MEGRGVVEDEWQRREGGRRRVKVWKGEEWRKKTNGEGEVERVGERGGGGSRGRGRRKEVVDKEGRVNWRGRRREGGGGLRERGKMKGRGRSRDRGR